MLLLAQIQLGQRQNNLWYLVERSVDGWPSWIWASGVVLQLAKRSSG